MRPCQNQCKPFQTDKNEEHNTVKPNWKRKNMLCSPHPQQALAHAWQLEACFFQMQQRSWYQSLQIQERMTQREHAVEKKPQLPQEYKMKKQCPCLSKCQYEENEHLFQLVCTNKDVPAKTRTGRRTWKRDAYEIDTSG